MLCQVCGRSGLLTVFYGDVMCLSCIGWALSSVVFSIPERPRAEA